MADTRDSKQIEQLQKPEAGHQETVAALKALMPQVFKEGKLDVEALREEVQLADELYEPSNTGEHYGLTWAGKSQAKKLATLAPSGTLHPVPGEGVDEDTTKNLLIEGDNLEVLRILQKSYAGRVKMIYIDPPYNTGNDFVYRDDFKEPVETYLQRTGQADEEGLLTSNPKASGRYHSNWLSMMYPRLRLARSLLREDGVIFVSIDDNEVQNLRVVMDEVFGEENFLAVLARRVKSGGGSAAHHFAVEHDYVVVYALSKENIAPLFIPHEEEYAKRYAEEDESGRYFWDTMERSYTATKPYKITAPDGTLLTGKWFRSEARFKDDLEKGEVRFLKKDDGGWSVQFKQRMPEGKKIRSLLHDNMYKSTHDEINTLDMEGTFSFPKPVTLIKLLLQAACSEDEIVLDFFAGSGTTAHAVMQLNAEDEGNRKYILVQLPEIDEKSEAAKKGYSTIAEVTKERVRRASTKIGAEHPDFEGDLGFCVLKLGRSNIRRWQAETVSSVEQIALQFEQHAKQPFVNDWTPESLITEVMLVEGYPLDSDVSKAEGFSGNAVYLVEHPEPLPMLLVCLDNVIEEETLDTLNAYSDDVFVCREDALNDETKLRLRDTVRRVKTL